MLCLKSEIQLIKGRDRTMAGFFFVGQAAADVLNRWGMAGTIGGTTIAYLVADGAAYWEQSLPDELHLALIRLFSPVVRREEVFLGAVLLNDFLSEALIRAVGQSDLGRMALLANDLGKYYYFRQPNSGYQVAEEQRRAAESCAGEVSICH